VLSGLEEHERVARGELSLLASGLSVRPKVALSNKGTP
jgi:hypothetical protein